MSLHCDQHASTEPQINSNISLVIPEVSGDARQDVLVKLEQDIVHLERECEDIYRTMMGEKVKRELLSKPAVDLRPLLTFDPSLSQYYTIESPEGQLVGVFTNSDMLLSSLMYIAARERDHWRSTRPELKAESVSPSASIAVGANGDQPPLPPSAPTDASQTRMCPLVLPNTNQKNLRDWIVDAPLVMSRLGDKEKSSSQMAERTPKTTSSSAGPLVIETPTVILRKPLAKEATEILAAFPSNMYAMLWFDPSGKPMKMDMIEINNFHTSEPGWLFWTPKMQKIPVRRYSYRVRNIANCTVWRKKL